MSIEFSPDLILHNGKIVTVDGGFSIQEAVAVFDGKIVAVGSSAETTALAGQRTRSENLHGRCVIPGQIDNHTHFLLAGMDALGSKAKVDIAMLQSIDEILDAIAARAKAIPKGEWIGTSCMYRGALKEGRFPTREDLDKAAPDHPVYIFQSGKNIIANSYALNMAGIDRDTPHPTEPEGWIVRDANDDPTGHLVAGAGDMARKAWWEKAGQPIKKWDFLYFDQERQIEAIKAQQTNYHACGVVGVREMGVSIDELDAYIEANRRHDLEDPDRYYPRAPVALSLDRRNLQRDQELLRSQATFG